MKSLNYQHLYYFLAVANNGTVSEAAKELRLAQPTVSTQLRSLEEQLGEQLFERHGRRLHLTNTGQTVRQYAERIFGLGKELIDVLEGQTFEKQTELHVGVVDVFPKYYTYKLLEPAIQLLKPLKIIYHEGRPEELLADLAIRHIDLVLSDVPVTNMPHLRVFNHFLAESDVSFFASPVLAKRYRDGFPHSLHRAPILLPTPNSMLRRSMDQWFEKIGVRPIPRGEFEDSAIVTIFAQRGMGICAAPTNIETELLTYHNLELIGRTTEMKERFYGISVERRVKHPAVLAICEAGKGAGN